MAQMRQAPEGVSELGFYEIHNELMVSTEPELTDLELLSSALQDALSARHAGIIAGPEVDEVALRRATRRALRADVDRALRAVGPGGAA